jgi:hypothetical protein
MSSHHFVKEGQEPALIIAGEFTGELAESFLEWSPLVIVLPEAIESVISKHIKVDVVIAYESVYDEMMIRFGYQMPVKLISIAAADNPIVTALDYLEVARQTDVVLFAAKGWKIFQTSEQYLNRISVTISDGLVKWSPVTSGKFEKWFPKGTMLQTKAESSVTAVNASPTVNDFEVLADGIVRLSSQGFFWVGEPIK